MKIKQPATNRQEQNLPAHLSVSQIQMLMNCPMQWEHRYAKGIILPPAVAMEEGNCHHEVLEEGNQQFIQRQSWPKVKDVVESFQENWKGRSKVIDWKHAKKLGDNDTKDTVSERGRELLKNYCATLRPMTKPQAAEQYFEVTIAGRLIVGYIDLLEKRIVSDYKVAGRVPSEQDMREHLQLALYSLVTGRPTGQIITLKRKGAPDVQATQGDFPADYWSGWWSRIVSTYGKMIDAGVFPPCHPSSWCCSERFCGYYHSCRGRTNRKVVQLKVSFKQTAQKDKEEIAD